MSVSAVQQSESAISIHISSASSVAQSCPSLCDPMTCSTPGFPVHPCLLKFMSIELVMHPIISSSVVPFSSCLQPFPATGSFQMSQFSPSGGQSIGVAALASVLPMNIQDWFLLGWTGLISLRPRDSQESSPTPQFKSIDSSALNFLFGPTLTSIQDYWKNSFD